MSTSTSPSPDPASPRGGSPPTVGHVVLVGLMGSGKSTVGRVLAANLGLDYVDNDAAFAGRTGSTPAEWDRVHGAEDMHREEAETLAATVAADRPAVIGAPASVASDVGSRELLGSQTVVWLRARPETLAARVQATAAHDDVRPFLGDGDDLVTLFVRQSRERGPHFDEIADVVVDVDEGTPETIAAEIVRALPRRHS